MSLLHDLLLYRILAKGKTVGQTELRDIVFRWLEDGMDSPYLLSFIIDIYEEDLEEGTAHIGTLKKAKDVSGIESGLPHFGSACNYCFIFFYRYAKH